MGWVGFVTNMRSCHWHGPPPNHPPPSPNRLKTGQENPNFLPYCLGQNELKLFELALEAPPAPDPAIWGTSSGFWGAVQDFQYSACTAIIAFSISPSGAEKLEVSGISDIFPPICGLKLKKKKQFAHFLQNSTQNPTESDLCTHSHVYTQGRCRCCPLSWETPNSSWGAPREKKTPNCPPSSPPPWQPPWPLPSLQLAPQIPFFSQFYLILAGFPAVFPRWALLFPPKWSCGRLCP